MNDVQLPLIIMNPVIREIAEGNIERVKLILGNNTEILKHSSEQGWSPLSVACKIGNVSIIEYLIHIGADTKEACLFLSYVDKKQPLATPLDFIATNSDIISFLEGSPYQSVQNVFTKQECTICWRTRFSFEMFKPQKCGHETCRDCAAEWFYTLMIDQFKSIVSCPTCREAIDEPELRLLCQETVIERYSRWLLVQNVFSRMPDFYQCPNVDCDFGGFAKFSKNCDSVSCNKCNYTWIPPGSQKYRFFTGFSQLVSDRLTRFWKFRNTRSCPRCNSPIQKNGGCPHMSCSCHYEFCWDCREPWSGHSVPRHLYFGFRWRIISAGFIVAALFKFHLWSWVIFGVNLSVFVISLRRRRYRLTLYAILFLLFSQYEIYFRPLYVLFWKLTMYTIIVTAIGFVGRRLREYCRRKLRENNYFYSNILTRWFTGMTRYQFLRSTGPNEPPACTNIDDIWGTVHSL